jgi:polysaccharide export outer membrane protein
LTSKPKTLAFISDQGRMNIKGYLFLIAAAILLFTSCSDKQYQLLFQQRNTIAPADTTTTARAVTLDRYQIQPQDALQIRNLQDIRYISNLTPISTNTDAGNAQQGETFQVEADSTVKLPALGNVKVVGLTRAEAQQKVEALYAASLLVNPIIELKIVNLKVTLLGEVKGQGNYLLIKDKTTLVEVIGEAGGLTDRADGKDIKIIRGNEKRPTVIDVDFGSIASVNDPKTILQSGDIIYVAQNRRAARTDNIHILFNTALIIFTLVKK